MTPARLSFGDFRDWIHQARRGNPWTFRRSSGTLGIAPIVSPLRFDITLRASFLRFYREHRDIYHSDFEAFAERAREHEYFVWFTRVACAVWKPDVLTDPRLFAAAWSDRLRATATLHDSFETRGFDSRFPITLYAGRRVHPTDTGKRVSREIYAGDGNHRLALLIESGHETLLPSHYRIKRFHRLVPADTTPLLVRALHVDEDRYLAFLRVGYPSLRFEHVDGRIDVNGPSATAPVAEVQELIRIDLEHLNAEHR